MGNIQNLYHNTSFASDNNGNVGIGTTDPVNKLNVNGDIGYIGVIGQGSIYGNTGNSSFSTMRLYDPATGYTTLNNQSYGYYFNTSGGTKVTILNGGNVGINVTNPNEKLHVDGNIRLDGSVFFSSSSVFNKILLNGTDMEIWSGALFPSIDITSGGLLKFGAYALSGAGTPTKLLGVDGSGNVLTTTASSIPGGPYLPLTGGTLSGALNITQTTSDFIDLTRDLATDQTWRQAISGAGSFSLYDVTRGADVFVLNTSGNVGIGTTSPSRKLQVIGTDGVAKFYYNSSFTNAQYSVIDVGMMTSGTAADGFGPKISFRMGGNGYDGYQTATIGTKRSGADNTHDLTFATSSSGSVSDKMIIKSNGNVGIGTTSPDDLLEIEGSADVYARVHYTGNGSNSPADVCGIKLEHGRATWNIRNTYNGGASYPDAAFSINSGTKANALTILNNTSSDIGIGTNAPTAKLHVNGSDFLVSNGGEEGINVDLDNYVYKFGDISGGENQSYFGISSANAQAYFLNCDVGIGTSLPNVPLDVTVSDTGSSFNDGAVQLSNTTSASSGGATVMNIRNNYGGGFGTLVKFFRTSTSSSIANISFNSGGTAVNYNTGSDYRLKEDLQTFNGLDILSNISVYNYKWKGVDFRGYGVIAHELQPIFPDAVTGEKDAEEMQSVDYSKLVPVLIKSVQELKKEIELLKQQLNK